MSARAARWRNRILPTPLLAPVMASSRAYRSLPARGGAVRGSARGLSKGRAWPEPAQEQGSRDCTCGTRRMTPLAVYYAGSGALAGSSRRVPSLRSRVLKEDSMSQSRRHFFRNLGLGSAGLLSTPFIIGRGSEAMAFEAGAMQPPDDGGFIRISSNENARGPGMKTIDALKKTISPRVGRGYPPDYTGDLVATIAEIYGVSRTTSSSAPARGRSSRARRAHSARRRSRSSPPHRPTQRRSRPRAASALRSS